MTGLDARYIADLKKLLEAEADLARDGQNLLSDPEYRVLRELFIDGELTLDQLADRIENLMMTRPD